MSEMLFEVFAALLGSNQRCFQSTRVLCADLTKRTTAFALLSHLVMLY